MPNAAQLLRAQGSARVQLKIWHGVALLIMLAVTLGIAEAAENTKESNLTVLFRWMPFILWGQEGHWQGFSLNIIISFFAMLLGTVSGAVLGLLQISLLAPVRAGSWLVTQFFRNSPWLVLLFTIMLLLPFEIRIGDAIIPIPDWVKAVIGFSLPVMANISEVVRGAVISLPSGQWESAESLAFTRFQTIRMVILPQCVKRMIPPWMNWYAILAMATPLCSIMGVEESVTFTQQALSSEGGRPELLASFYVFLLVIFFIYIYPIARLTVRLERKFLVMN
ncbi:MAG: amino acid ABC transporter permease [Lysobacterales bacterium]|nr:MAG: amino acid ABC transporter permease [Xanthomonadales bacterium]